MDANLIKNPTVTLLHGAHRKRLLLPAKDSLERKREITKVESPPPVVGYLAYGLHFHSGEEEGEGGRLHYRDSVIATR